MTVTRNIVLKTLLFFSVFFFASSKEKRCEKIKIPMCKGYAYNFTYMPNILNHATQEEAALELHQFWPLVEIKCSPYLKPFLCSAYTPMCQPNFQDDIPPCRSVCEQARKGCARLMRQYGFSWPKRLKCRNFPELGGVKLCMGFIANETTKAPPTYSIATTKMSNEDKCQKIKIPMCQGIGYNLTHFPNMFNHDTQEEAALEVHQFWPLVEIKCSPYLKPFLCSMYAPICQPNSKDEVPPCRSVCESARTGCAPLLRQYGFSWPKRMECSNFPESGGDRLCLDVRAYETTKAPVTVSLATTKMSNKDKCEKIKIPMCQGIGYNFTTSMPNIFNHSTQEEAAIAVRRFRPLVNINCSPDLRFFLCSVYAPICQPTAKDHVPPCRSLCRRVRKGCAPLVRLYGISWPKQMRCKIFPKPVGDRLCIDPKRQ